MNEMSLKARLKNKSKETHVDFNTLLKIYMYDRFIERLSLSKYKNEFILKGGFYLSNFFGLNDRTTKDIDALIKNKNFNKEYLVEMFEEIISIDIQDGAKLLYKGIEEIKQNDKYDGYSISIEVKFGKIKETIPIDVVTGDKITPEKMEYKYKLSLDDKYVKIFAYNIETVLAEKIETVFRRADLNSRMKDFYDIYLIYSRYWSNINVDIFKEALINTMSNRNYVGDPLISIEIIKNNSIMISQWKNYQNSHDYAKNIDFNNVVDIIEVIYKAFID